MRVLDLFSGIGGFSLGLERAGMETVAFCEIEPFCRKVLAKHWPDVPCYDDVRELTHDRLAADGITGIDVICGGFPCQDISIAGKGAGIKGERSGLWSEFARLIGEVRPRYAIVENVSALLRRGLADVLGDLAAVGYDAEWHCIPASQIGAHHRRDRVWIVAHADGAGLQERFMFKRISAEKRRHDNGQNAPLAGARFAVPEVVRRFHGIPRRVDRITALGNAVVPQIPELIGKAIMEAA